jgi:putative FmdB family regulatory protein
MPAYDFVCESCHNEFEVWGTVEEYTKGLVHKCPFCGAKNIEQKLDSFTIMSGKKRGSGGPSCCGPNSGSGCCG